MSDHVYKKIELTGSSEESSDQAVRNAIAKASKTIKKTWIGSKSSNHAARSRTAR